MKFFIRLMKLFWYVSLGIKALPSKMTFSRVRLYFCSLLGVAALLCTVTFVQDRMNQIIIEKKLTDTDPVENAPPIVAFTTVALGGFRGLLADILWLRTINLQDKGKYFEMVQLASWITKLQPRFTGATCYLAWNMAYNISVTCSSFKDRWRWVQQGLELIRDEALHYNPGDPLLYKELGWIYQHKIGNIMDDANQYYKTEMAIELTKVYGSANPNWEKLAEAPKKESGLLKEMDASLETKNFLDFLAKNGYQSLNALEKAFRETGELPEKLTKILQPDEKEKLTYWLRSQWIKQVYKMDPEVILEINNKYGALDWRLPESMAIYWATMGQRKSPDKQSIDCERMIVQSLAVTFKSGRLLMVDEGKSLKPRIMTIPNFKVLDALRDEYMATIEKRKKQNSSRGFHSGMMNFLKDAVVTLYTWGSYSKAKECLKYLREGEPGNKLYKIPLEQFVRREWTEDVRDASMKQAHLLVTGMLFRSCYLLAFGAHEEAVAHERLARVIYKIYSKEQQAAAKRVGLPPFNEIKKEEIKKCLKAFPPILSSNLSHAIKLEKTK